MPRAPRRCPGDDYDCDSMVMPGRRHCPQHERGWADAPRTASSCLTASSKWRALAARILDRDRRECQIRTPGICAGRATVVDKIESAARRPDLAFDPANLRAACQPCNARKGRTADRRTAR